MVNIQIVDYPVFLAFWLAFSRWLTIVIQLPLFDGMPIPQIVKILVAMVVTYAFFPFIKPYLLQDIVYMGEQNFWLLILFNTLVGLTVGLLVRSIMGIFISAGLVISQQIGFAAAAYFDPVSARQTGPLEKIIQWTMLVLIITSGSLHPMFKGIVGTFSSIHIYAIGKLSNSPLYFVDLFKEIFLSALLLASPLIFTNLLMMALLGIVSRVVPQMNVIMVSFVVNIGLGLLVFAVMAEEFFQVGFKIYTDQLGRWFRFVV